MSEKSEESEEYVLGSSEREIERLAFQNEVWSKETARLWEEAGVSYGEKILDLGCGPGFCTVPLAHLVGRDGHVFAVDSSAKFVSMLENKIEHLGLRNISVQRENADSINLPAASVDAVFARWLFCFLENPAKVVEEAKNILKPGGRLIVLDYFNYRAANVFPRNEFVSELFRAYLQIVTETGGSYDVGEILPQIMSEKEFEIESMTPVARIARPGSRVWKWVEFFNEVSVPALVEQGVWSESRRDEFEKEWANAARNPAAFFFPPPMIGIVARKK